MGLLLLVPLNLNEAPLVLLGCVVVAVTILLFCDGLVAAGGLRSSSSNSMTCSKRGSSSFEISCSSEGGDKLNKS